MTFSIRNIIRGFVAPDHQLSCSSALWQEGLAELRNRTEGVHESGAFLLGERNGAQRRIRRFVYYDDLDPHALATGIVVFDGAGYGPLWELCRTTGLRVVADIHVHPGRASQSKSDRENPMIAQPGHIALIVPNLAAHLIGPRELGIYEYQGQHQWLHCNQHAEKYFYIGFWG